MTQNTDDPGIRARRLIRASDRAALATTLAAPPEADPPDASSPGATPDAAPGAAGWPYASLVMVACDHAAAPLLLISDLAEHTRNIAADGRASLMFDGTAGLDNPLTGARATVMGRVAVCHDEALVARYVRRHPDAARYLEFADFQLYRMAVERVHIVAGFGAIDWLAAADVLFDDRECGALAAREADIVDHMNADHADAVALYAGALLGLDGPGGEGNGWSMTGIDPEGCDLRCAGRVARIDFDQPVRDGEAARATLVRLVGDARREAG